MRRKTISFACNLARVYDLLIADSRKPSYSRFVAIDSKSRKVPARYRDLRSRFIRVFRNSLIPNSCQVMETSIALTGSFLRAGIKSRNSDLVGSTIFASQCSATGNVVLRGRTPGQRPRTGHETSILTETTPPRVYTRRPFLYRRGTSRRFLRYYPSSSSKIPR